MGETTATMLVVGIPAFLLAICWISLMWAMRKTTGELKLFLQPNNLVKLFTLYLIVAGTILLSMLKIIEGESAGVIFSGIIGYTLGTKFKSEDWETTPAGFIGMVRVGSYKSAGLSFLCGFQFNRVKLDTFIKVVRSFDHAAFADATFEDCFG